MVVVVAVAARRQIPPSLPVCAACRVLSAECGAGAMRQ